MNDQTKTKAQLLHELATLRSQVDNLEQVNQQLRQEITAQKQTIHELKQKESLWQAVLKNLPINFWARDLDERIIIQSEVEIKIWGDMHNKTLDETTHLNQAIIEKWRQSTQRVLTGEIITEEVEMTTPAGEWKFLHKIVAPIYVEEELQGIMGVNIDLTDRKLAEKALQKSEERLRLIIENMPIMVNAADDDLAFVAWNQECEHVTGYTAEEIIKNPKAWELLYPDKAYREAMLSIADDASRPDGYREREWVLNTKDGQNRTIMWSEVPEQFRVADWTYWGIGLDVTEQRQAEQALRESEERFRSLYSMVKLMCDNVPDLIWAKDMKEKFIFVNRATCEKLLNTKNTDEPIGKLHQYFTARERETYPHHPGWYTFGEICTDSDKIVMKKRLPQRFDEFGNVEGKLLHLDVYKAPFWNEQGEMIGTVGCGRIVTREKEIEAQRRRTEAELQEIKKRYELATTAGQVWVWDWKLDINKPGHDSGLMKALGYDSQKIQNNSDFWSQIIHPDDLNHFRVEIEKHLAHQTEQFEFEYRLQSRQGDYRWFLARGSAIQDNESNSTRLMGTATDITKQKQASQQLQTSLQEKEVLLREIHHRVKNNLQIISSLFDLQIDYLSDERLVKILEECQRRIQAMSLVHQALYHSENLSKINIPDYLNSLINQLQAAYIRPPHNIKLTLEIEDCYLHIDKAVYCGLIINELVSNALKHAFPHNQSGQIQVQLSTDSINVSLTVADTGIGFPAGIKIGQEGSLGLLLVNTFIKQLEGIMSLTQNNGTIFHISFPKSLQMEEIS